MKNIIITVLIFLTLFVILGIFYSLGYQRGGSQVIYKPVFLFDKGNTYNSHSWGGLRKQY